jgi:hypothetical protein
MSLNNELEMVDPENMERKNELKTRVNETVESYLRPFSSSLQTLKFAVWHSIKPLLTGRPDSIDVARSLQTRLANTKTSNYEDLRGEISSCLRVLDDGEPLKKLLIDQKIFTAAELHKPTSSEILYAQSVTNQISGYTAR